jgi:benzylsuccinate CoA-transferase BbsF subunit
MSLLEHIQVTELAPHLSVKVCGRALADLGAVVHAQSDAGDDATSALVGAALDASKTGSGSTPATKHVFIGYGNPSTVVDGPQDPHRLRLQHPDAVIVHLSPFGLTGPRADEPACDLTLFAASGIAHLLTGQTEAPDVDPPQRAVGEQSAFIGGLAAACAATAALGAPNGALVDISLHEALATLAITDLTRAANTGKTRTRQRRGDGNGATVCTLPCSDGHVAISPREERQWRAWLEVMGNPAWSGDARFALKADRERNWDALYTHLCEWSRQHTRAWIAAAAQQARVPSFPLRRPEESLASAQLEARGFFHPTKLDGKTYQLPGRPYALTGGGDSQPAMPGPTNLELPLSGITVLDFSWVIAGPTATRYLAALGADVIKVEAPDAGDPGRASELHSVLGQSKRAIVLDLKHPEGQAIARKLAARSDIVLENFATGVMERFGLGANTLREHNPGLTYVSASGMGREGPEANAVAYGTLLQCYSGFTELNGTPGHAPRVGMAWLDPMCGLILAMLCHSAIESRRHGRAGVRIDFSMIEAMLWTMLEPLVAVQQAQVVQPAGNASNGDVHDIWRAHGDDAWVAIAATSDTTWRSLCERVPGLAALSEWKEDERRANRAMWDEMISAWCSNTMPAEVSAALSAQGVPAAAVVNALGLVSDPHLAARKFWDNVGQHRLPGLPWRSDLGRQLTPAPALGGHTDPVLRELLDLDDEQVARIRQSGALGPAT